MNCPVCNHKNIPELAIVCPTCGSDIVNYALLDSIEEEYRSVLKEKIATEGDLVATEQLYKQRLKSSNRLFRRTLLLLLLLPLIYFTCGKRHIPTKVNVQPYQDSISLLTQQLQEAKSENQRLANTQVDSIWYVVKEEDSLFKIAKLFYNNGEAYPQIVEDNRIRIPRKIEPGDSIVIKFR